MQKSFKEAKDAAPAILFIDEIDAFGSRDDAEGNNASYDIKAINGLLEQLDGIEGREGVIVVAACNHPKIVDAAILRAGRLDRHVEISLPDQRAREAIFKMHLHDSLGVEDYHDFAAATAGLSGADIQKIVRNARSLHDGGANRSLRLMCSFICLSCWTSRKGFFGQAPFMRLAMRSSVQSSAWNW